MLIQSPKHTHEDLEIWRTNERTDALRAKRLLRSGRIERARSEIEAFACDRRCYAGVSWGKDSLVLARLIWDLRDRVWIPLVWIRVEPIVNPDCARVRDLFLAAHPGLAYDEIEIWCRRDADGWHATGTLEAGFAEAAHRYGARHVSGIRAAESGQRKRRMMHFGETSANTCAPIGWWSTADVFAFLHAHDLPVHPAYAMSGNGLWSRDRIRVASLGGQRGTGHGRAEWERRYYPDAPR